MFEKVFSSKHTCILCCNVVAACTQVNSAEKILELLNLGNSRRKTESTDVNETSSRWVDFFQVFLFLITLSKLDHVDGVTVTLLDS